MRVPVGAPFGPALVPPRRQTSLRWNDAGAVVRGARDRRHTMREEVASYSFLAVTVAGLVPLFTGLVAFAFG